MTQPIIPQPGQLNPGSLSANGKPVTGEEYFRNMLDNVPAIIWVTETDGSCSFLNRQWYEATGQTYEEGLGFGWLSVTHPDDTENAGEIFMHANKNQIPFKILYRLRHKNGEYRWSVDSGTPRFDAAGNYEGFIGSVTDVHEQKLSEEKYRNLFETMEQGFCIVEMIYDENNKPVDYRFLEFNSIFSQQTGLQNALGKTARELLPALESHWFDIYGNVALTGESIRFTEGSDVMGRWFDVYAFSVGDNESRKVALLFSDISERKRAEKTLRESEEKFRTELEELVNERTEQLKGKNIELIHSEKLLEQKNRELERSNDDLQQFAHVASHDLKEPVRKVRTFASLLQHELNKQDPAKAQVFLSKIENAAARMYAMIDGVLLYSTIDSIQETVEPVDLNEIIRQVELDLELVIAQKAAVIECEKLPVIEGSVVLMQQLFYNLLYNSLKFSSPNRQTHINISARMNVDDKLKLSLDLPAETSYCQIAIADNGIGFAQEYASNIFKTFTRLNTKDKYEGTGLGLALCKKIAERHGGAIYAESKEGTGSVFYVLFPCKR